jgi:hypothetical protein
VRTWFLTAGERAAARALAELMVRIRLVYYYPALAARVPVREICRAAAGAGGAILAAAARRGPARHRAFAELGQRWRRVPADLALASIKPGPATPRYAADEEPHEDDYDIRREGSVVLVAAVPDADPAAPWRLVGEEVPGPVRFRDSLA